MLAAEQDERRRIALFLHDGPVQSLAGVALMLDAVARLHACAVRHEQARRDPREGDVRTRTTIGELRDLSFNLEPVVLRDHGFSMAVRALGEDRGIEHGIQVEIDVAAAETLGERSQAALYQIVREALEGAIRRGPPKTFSVAIGAGRAADARDDDPRRRAERAAASGRSRCSRSARARSARRCHVEHDDDGTTMRLVLPVYAGSE